MGAEAQPVFYHMKRPDVVYPAAPLGFPDLNTSLFSLPVASDFINDQGQLCVRNGDPQHLQPLAEYWQEVGMPQQTIDRILHEDGTLKYIKPDEDITKLFEVDPLTAGLRMVDMLSVLYGNSQHALDASIKRVRNEKELGGDGMNAHDERHIERVVRDSNRFILQAGQFRGDIGLQQVYETAFSAAGHDNGQAIQTLHRTGQEQASIFLLSQIMPAFAQKYPQYWESMTRAIMLHPEANLKDLIKDREDKIGKKFTSDETVRFMYETLTPVTLALVLADKLHIGQDRLPPKWRDPDGLLRDWNLINACFKTENTTGYSPDGKTFTINMTYTAGPENDRLHPATYTAPDGEIKDRFWMPDAIDAYMRNPDKRKRIAHSEVVEAMMWKQYDKRLRIAILTAFALNPATETVEINFNDSNAREALKGLLPPNRIDEVANRTYKFRRDNVDHILQLITNRYKNMCVDLDDLRKKGDALLPVAPEAAEASRRLVA